MNPRRAANSVLMFVLGLIVLSPRLAAQATDWRQIQAPPLPAFHPQQPKRIQLSNGMVIFLNEDHELPLVAGRLRFAVAPGTNRQRKSVVQIFGEVWRTGGTESKTGDQLDDYLEAHAAKVETSPGRDFTTVNADCLRDNFDAVFKVFLKCARTGVSRGQTAPGQEPGKYCHLPAERQSFRDLLSRGGQVGVRGGLALRAGA